MPDDIDHIDPGDDADADDPDVEATPRREPRTVPAGLFIVAVLVAGVFGVLAIIAVGLDSDDDGGGDTAVRIAAGDYAERFLSLGYDSYDAWLEDMRSIGTGGFIESLRRREDAYRTLLDELQVSWEGTAVDVYVTEVNGGVVSAVVLFDLAVTDREGTRVTPDQYLRIDMVDGPDGWLIEEAITITQASGVPASGTETPPVVETPPSTTTSEPPE